MRWWSRTILWLVLLLCPLASAGARAVWITVVGTADFHGGLEAKRLKEQGRRQVGGIDIIAAYLQAVRESNPAGSIFLDAGDLYQGSLISAANEGRAVIEFYNEIGYDAVAVGNHDFDFGPVGYHSVPQAPGEDPLGAIKARIAQARFPFLAANMVEAASGRMPAWKNLHPYVVLERRGVKIGVIGLISEQTPLITNPVNVRSLRFLPLLEAARRNLARVRQLGAGVTILVVHAGIERDAASGRAVGPVADLARALRPGEVDLILSGHAHRAFSDWVNGIPVMQTPAKGVAFVRADLQVDVASGQVRRCQVKLTPNTFYFRSRPDGRPPRYLGRSIQPVAHYKKRLAEYKKTIAHLERIHLGRALRDMPNQTRLDSPVGNLVTDAMRAFRPDIDIAMYNSGGLRAPIRRGVITYGKLYEVVPFDNYIVVVPMTAGEIRAVIEHGLSGPYGVMEISGLRVGFDGEAPAGQRCRSLVGSDGRELVSGRTYLVATNDFVFRGGDGYDLHVEGKRVEKTHRLVREVVAAYIKNRNVISWPADKRYRSEKHKHVPGSSQ